MPCPPINSRKRHRKHNTNPRRLSHPTAYISNLLVRIKCELKVFHRHAHHETRVRPQTRCPPVPAPPSSSHLDTRGNSTCSSRPAPHSTARHRPPLSHQDEARRWPRLGCVRGGYSRTKPPSCPH